jgi:hypothetical protein
MRASKQLAGTHKRGILPGAQDAEAEMRAVLSSYGSGSVAEVIEA